MDSELVDSLSWQSELSPLPCTASAAAWRFCSCFWLMLMGIMPDDAAPECGRPICWLFTPAGAVVGLLLGWVQPRGIRLRGPPISEGPPSGTGSSLGLTDTSLWFQEGWGAGCCWSSCMHAMGCRSTQTGEGVGAGRARRRRRKVKGITMEDQCTLFDARRTVRSFRLYDPRIRPAPGLLVPTRLASSACRSKRGQASRQSGFSKRRQLSHPMGSPWGEAKKQHSPTPNYLPILAAGCLARQGCGDMGRTTWRTWKSSSPGVSSSRKGLDRDRSQEGTRSPPMSAPNSMGRSEQGMHGVCTRLMSIVHEL